MLLRKSAFILATVMILATPALAANWLFVARNQDGSSHFIDDDSITLDQNSQETSFRVMILVTPKNMSVERQTIYTHDIINCSERSHKITNFYQKGAEPTMVDEPFQSIVSGSIVDKYYDFVCR
jgi:hypothetical protein